MDNRPFYRSFLCAAALLQYSTALGAAPLPDWPQFRGPGGAGVSATASPPAEFSESKNLLWKTAVPAGYSSPVVVGDRIFLTGGDDGKLETFAIDLRNGKIIWRRSAAGEKFVPSDASRVSGRAASTPVTDGTFVYVQFGMVGVIAYDLEGKEQWRKPFEKPDEEISSSPILIDDKLIFVCDMKEGSFIEALDKKTGRSIWRTERPRMRYSVSTPFHWVNDKREELIVSGSYWLMSYDPRSGAENWRYSGFSKSSASSPVAARALLFSAGTPLVNEPPEGREEPDAAMALTSITDFTRIVDTTLPRPESALLAIRSCGRGEVSGTHLAWKNTRSLPGSSSPIFYADRLFTVKAGGFVSAYNIEDGTPIYRDERLNAPGDYYASAVAADGRVYFISLSGVITVVDAKANELRVLQQNKLGEQVLATPALVGKTILIRTEKNLYSFGEQ